MKKRLNKTERKVSINNKKKTKNRKGETKEDVMQMCKRDEMEGRIIKEERNERGDGRRQENKNRSKSKGKHVHPGH